MNVTSFGNRIITNLIKLKRVLTPGNDGPIGGRGGTHIQKLCEYEGEN